MAGTRLLSRQADLSQLTPHRRTMHGLTEALLADPHKVLAREGANPVRLRVGTRHHDGVKLRQLVRLQPWRATAAPAIAQTIDPLRVVADHPIAQRLPIHTSRLR